MKYTDNLNLKKPEQTEFYNVDDFNENADILDAEIQGIKNTFVKSVNGINAGDDGNVDLGIIPISQGGTGQTTASGVRNALGLGNTTGAVPIANGGTGATTAENARKNLGANDFVTSLSVSGKTITYNKKDGTSGTITTQDTVYTHPTTSGNKHIPSGGSSGQILRWSADGIAVWGADNNTSNWTISKGDSGWARDNSTGFTIEWGTVKSNSSATFPRTFTTLYGVHTQCEGSAPYEQDYITNKSTSGFKSSQPNSSKSYTLRYFAYGVS